MAEESKNQVSRREIIRTSLNTVAGLTIGGISGMLIRDAASEDTILGYNIYQYPRMEDIGAGPGAAPVNKVNETLVVPPYTLPEESYHKHDRFWVVAVDHLGQEGIPSVPVWFGDHYSNYYSGDWHQ